MPPPAVDPRPWRRGAGVVGRLLVYAGVVVGAIAAYLVFGTAGIAAQAQRTLRADFASLADPVAPAAPAVDTTSARSDPSTTAPDRPRSEPPDASGAADRPEAGSPVARLRIPAIGLDRIVVEGVGTAELRRGPGHYPGTSHPGETGNVGIAGHRTTYGAPFGNLDRLAPSDRITLDTTDGRSFTYEVIGTEIVDPGQVRVLADVGDDRLTLTSCHPKRSARRRIVVSAVLVADEATALHVPAPSVVPATPGSTELLPSGDAGAELAGSPAVGAVAWVWFALGVAANEARHRSRRWRRQWGRHWSVAGRLAMVLVMVGATWRGIVVVADLIQWNV
jgi:sortase A